MLKATYNTEKVQVLGQLKNQNLKIPAEEKISTLQKKSNAIWLSK